MDVLRGSLSKSIPNDYGLDKTFALYFCHQYYYHLNNEIAVRMRKLFIYCHSQHFSLLNGHQRLKYVNFSLYYTSFLTIVLKFFGSSNPRLFAHITFSFCSNTIQALSFCNQQKLVVFISLIQLRKQTARIKASKSSENSQKWHLNQT